MGDNRANTVKHRVKDTRRRARLMQQRTAQAAVTTKVVPDRREKLKQHAERQDKDRY